MRVEYEILGKDLPRDCRLYVPITYCLNCDEPIRNETESHKEYCSLTCEDEHREIMKLALSDELTEENNEFSKNLVEFCE